MLLSPSFLGLAGLVLVPVIAEDAPCTARSGDDYYDLSSLSARYVTIVSYSLSFSPSNYDILLSSSLMLRKPS